MAKNTTQAPAPVAVSTKKSEAQIAADKLAKVRKNVTENYPHALVDTLTWDAVYGKYKCKIRCVVSGNEDRWVFTSDLFQVNMCEAEATKAKKAKKALAKAEIAAARAEIKARAEVQS